MIFLVFLLKPTIRYSVVNLISELKATPVLEMGGLDYDTIVHAYEKISMEFFYIPLQRIRHWLFCRIVYMICHPMN